VIDFRINMAFILTDLTVLLTGPLLFAVEPSIPIVPWRQVGNYYFPGESEFLAGFLHFGDFCSPINYFQNALHLF
jgi:ABC-type multidrug transport system permease subunit